jgi:hypothetical protein
MSINAIQRTAGARRFQVKVQAVGGAPAAADVERYADGEHLNMGGDSCAFDGH